MKTFGETRFAHRLRIGGVHWMFNDCVHGPLHPFLGATRPRLATRQPRAVDDPFASSVRNCAARFASLAVAGSGMKARSPLRPSPFISPCTSGVNGSPDCARANIVTVPVFAVEKPLVRTST